MAASMSASISAAGVDRLAMSASSARRGTRRHPPKRMTGRPFRSPSEVLPGELVGEGATDAQHVGSLDDGQHLRHQLARLSVLAVTHEAGLQRCDSTCNPRLDALDGQNGINEHPRFLAVTNGEQTPSSA